MAKKQNYFNKYIQRTKNNELHFGNVTTEKLIELTRSMTAVCFLGRPACSHCSFLDEPLYCPPEAAKQVLKIRGYERVEVLEGLKTRIEYNQNTLMPIELAVTI